MHTTRARNIRPFAPQSVEDAISSVHLGKDLLGLVSSCAAPLFLSFVQTTVGEFQNSEVYLTCACGTS